MKTNLIGISGYAGSCKDTVAKMVLWITEPGIQDLWGYDIKSFLTISPFGDWVWQIKKFATKLKQICVLLTGCSLKDLESQEFKSTISPLRITYRELLQRLGTEVGRNINENIWIDSLFADYLPKKFKSDSIYETTFSRYPNWIISDMRFPNEFNAVKERGGITIRVVRGIGVNGHISESALDGVIHDRLIINDGSIEDLLKKVTEFYATIS